MRDLQFALRRPVEPAAHLGDTRALVAVLGGTTGQYGDNGRQADDADVPLIH